MSEKQLTVSELIEKLKEMPQDSEVCGRNLVTITNVRSYPVRAFGKDEVNVIVLIS